MVASLVLAPVLAHASSVVTAHRFSILYTDVPTTVCGVSGNYTIHIFIRDYRLVVKDDGTYTVFAVHSVNFYLNNTLIAFSPQTQLINSDGMNQFNVVVKCVDGGFDVNGHAGYILTDGVISDIHYSKN